MVLATTHDMEVRDEGGYGRKKNTNSIKQFLHVILSVYEA
jgi:hypothetical protein